jgi:hypothetical protein
VVVPEITGTTVARGGANPEIIPVVAVAVSTAFTAVTTARILEFESANVITNVELVAPAIDDHAMESLELCH